MVKKKVCMNRGYFGVQDASTDGHIRLRPNVESVCYSNVLVFYMELYLIR